MALQIFLGLTVSGMLGCDEAPFDHKSPLPGFFWQPCYLGALQLLFLLPHLTLLPLQFIGPEGSCLYVVGSSDQDSGTAPGRHCKRELQQHDTDQFITNHCARQTHLPVMAQTLFLDALLVFSS